MNDIIERIIPYHKRQKARAYLNVPVRIIGLLRNYFYDLSHFTCHSSSLQFFSSKQQLQSWIDADYHKIEKGLALNQPRPGFGQGVVNRLIRQIHEYLNKYGNDHSVQNGISILNAYMEFNQKLNVDLQSIDKKILYLVNIHLKQDGSGGCEKINKVDWLANAKVNLLPFFKSRHSVRDFSSAPVSYSLIEQAVEMTVYTPTVCNRQAAKVHAFTDEDERNKVIQCQMGNSGFGDQIKVLLMVTVDRQCFFSAGERNQCWIDGGLLSMSLIYALHSLGLATCCLNWSVTKQQDKKLRSTIEIHDSEAVIMMIAVGHLKEEFNIAKSTRKPNEHFLIRGKCK